MTTVWTDQDDPITEYTNIGVPVFWEVSSSDHTTIIEDTDNIDIVFGYEDITDWDDVVYPESIWSPEGNAVELLINENDELITNEDEEPILVSGTDNEPVWSDVVDTTTSWTNISDP